MGIENRDYYREAHAAGAWADWGVYSVTPVVKFLIIANIVVFVLQIAVVREVRVSPLETLRKHNPELDRMLTETEDDPAAREALKKKHPEIERLLEESEAE